jgi:hypothetical protein
MIIKQSQIKHKIVNGMNRATPVKHKIPIENKLLCAYINKRYSYILTNGIYHMPCYSLQH